MGKSTLFNRIVGERLAVVEDEAGTTRDRNYGDGEWNGRRFMIVDTGGLEVTPRQGNPADSIESKVQEQARLAIGEADVVVFVVDAAAGVTPADREAADLLRAAPAPVIIAVNKADNQKRDLEANEFYELGWGEIYPISASHGRGTGDLLDAHRLGAAARDRRRDRAQAARGGGRRMVARRGSGQLEAFVVGTDPDDFGPTGSTPRTPTPRPTCLTEDDAGRRWDAMIAAESRTTAGRDRDRGPAERRQVEPAQRAARRGAGDRQRGPGHDARCHRHAARVGPLDEWS